MHLSSSLPELIQHRQQFPALATKYYFNYGGQGPLPQGAIAALHTTQDYFQQAGPFSSEVGAWTTEESQRLRSTIAQELGTQPQTIALTENVSVGCNIALWGLDWREGDHLLLSDCEHPGVVAAVEEIRQRFGVKVSRCPLQTTLNAGDPSLVIAQHLLPTTRLVVLSHVLWNTGQVLPLAEIAAVCRQHPTQYAPVRILVDAAQSVGVLPLQVEELGVDFYAFTGHKWWCGPAGVGGLYVRSESMDCLRPTFVGWRNITTDSTGCPTGFLPDARRYEVATSDYTHYSALQVAIALHNQWGSAVDRYQRICNLSTYLWQRLQRLPFIHCLRTAPPESGLVSFQLKGNEQRHRQLVGELEKRNIMVRTIPDPNCVRVCVHYLTLEEEIDRLIETLQFLVG